MLPTRIPPPAPARAEAAADPEDPLELPAPWSPPTRPGVPILASVVPVLGALALWLVTGSVLALWLAALGPLIAGATMLDGMRGARRDRRRAHADARRARERIAQEIGRRHAQERARRWARHPDVAAYLARDGEIWRPNPDRSDAVVLGAGVERSSVRVSGGGEEAAQLRARAARLEDAPVVVSAAGGIAVLGNEVPAAAVARALALQLCLALPPGRLRIIGPLRGADAWADALPHRRAVTGSTLCLVGPGDPVPAGADIVIARAHGAAPPACGTVLTVHAPRRAVVDDGGEPRQIAVEGIAAGQAAIIARALEERAARLLGAGEAAEPVALGALLPGAPPAARGSLPAVIGVAAGEAVQVDLVADGPHAVVAGVTGSGKSELLITWVLSLCATHSTREVSFLLADFKGGTAFDALAGVPHVTGVITDLDGAGARRAIESLRAEVRWREAELARAGVRDILSPAVDLPRLVIVVDEFAALLGDHPELNAVFTDVAARGRALGMHLVLGTQRPSGVVRDSLLANCPLRISLRVTDPADSRALLGTDEAAALPGGTPGRGRALLRTASDAAPRRVRIALSSADDVAAVADAAAGPRPRRPWLPELPARIDLEDLAAHAGGQAGSLLLGLADEPDRQRQRPVGIRLEERGMLVVGGGGSGKSTALHTLAAQAPGPVRWIAEAAEEAWDQLAAIAQEPPVPGTLVVIDDLDAVVASFPPDYGREFIERLEELARGAGAGGILVAVSAQRLSGGVTRVADLLPRRLQLASSSRSEHIALGGDPAHYAPGAAPGRGRLDGRAIQVAIGPRRHARPTPPAEPWLPRGPLTGAVLRRSPLTRAALAEWTRQGAHVISLAEFTRNAEWATGSPVIVTGDGDEWQQHWRALTSMQSEHDLVIDASYGAQFRMLTGERSLPPYCRPGRPRAWLISAGGAPERINLPTADAAP